MARTSKRYVKTETSTSKEFFRAGVYVRLSNERKEAWRDKSYSPQMQTQVCEEYAQKEGIEVVEVYEDYEYSGTNFERPAYIRMMSDIRSRKINCIIIRDLSRLGREHLEMGRLVDKVFPFLGVRFISVSDKLDTFKGVDNNKSFEIMLKNIINDLYAKDVSTKIITAKHMRAKEGYFIGSVPPYGYKIDKTTKGQKLVIDEVAAPIIKLIFDLTLSGMSQYLVAKELNERMIAPGMYYYKTGNLYREIDGPQWHKSTIAKIIRNEVYTGTLAQGKKRQSLVEGMKQRLTDKDEWIVVENAHESIITKEVFEQVQLDRLERKANHQFAAPPHDFQRDPVNRYQGLIFAKQSGEPMFRRTRIYGKNRDRLYYCFKTENQSGKINNNVRVSILENDLDAIIQTLIKDFANEMGDEQDILNRISQTFFKRQEELILQKKKYLEKLDRIEAIGYQIYEQYGLSEVDRETYLERKTECDLQQATYKKEVQNLEAKLHRLNVKLKKGKVWINNIFKADKELRLDSELISSLIERIEVEFKNKISVVFRFDLKASEVCDE